MPRVWPARVCSLVIALWMLGAAGCVSVASTSLMPPTLVGAGPARGAVRVDLSSTGLTGLDRADVAGSGSQWVSSGRIDLRAQARASRYFGARFFGTLALADWLVPASAGEAQRPGVTSGGIGVGFWTRISIEGETTTIDLAWDQGVHVLGGVYCETSTSCRDVGELQLDFEGSAWISHMPVRWVRVLGGLGVRTHPHADGAFAAGASTGSFRVGGSVLVLGVGAEVHVTEWLSFAPSVQWAVAGAPFTYFPTLGLTLSFTMPGGPGRDPWGAPMPADQLGRPWR